MYKDPQRWSLAFQSYVQLTMLEIHNKKQVQIVCLAVLWLSDRSGSVISEQFYPCYPHGVREGITQCFTLSLL